MVNFDWFYPQPNKYRDHQLVYLARHVLMYFLEGVIATMNIFHAKKTNKMKVTTFYMDKIVLKDTNPAKYGRKKWEKTQCFYHSIVRA